MMDWLRRVTFADVYGAEVMVDGRRETRPSYCKQTYIFRQNSRRWIRKLANFRFRDHFDKRSTYYYMGDPTSRSTLVMIDIDVQKSKKLGTTAGAWKYAEHLKLIWPNLYFESSTGGKGVHGYVVVDKFGHDAEEVNAFLKQFQQWLRDEASVIGADIELVEVKGTCPVISKQGHEIVSVRYGQFAKIPRTEGRFEELRSTTVLDIRDALPANSGPIIREVKPTKANSSGGSIAGRVISDDELALIPKFERLYADLGLDLRHSRYLVTPHDFAVFCVLLRYFTENENADGTLPVRRVEALWQSLFAVGDARRPFNHHRFKVLRDVMSQYGHIHWVDNRYERPEGENKGVACKWRLTGHFLGVLDAAGEGEASFVVSDEFHRGTGEFKVPVPWLIRAEREKKWWKWALDRVENYEFYQLAA